jgi:SprT protein
MQFDFLKRLFTPRPRPTREVRLEIRAARPAPPDAEELLAVARRLLMAAGAPSLAGRVQVRWNPRMRSTAGTAFPARSLVTLNPRLAEFGAEEVSRTLRHELAHLLAYERAGRRRIAPHGAEWRRACRDLGLPGEKRTHDLPLPRRQRKPRYFYRCPSCAVEVARVVPLKRGSACLRCCRSHNRGRYDARFRFVLLEPSGEDSAF